MAQYHPGISEEKIFNWLNREENKTERPGFCHWRVKDRRREVKKIAGRGQAAAFAAFGGGDKGNSVGFALEI